MTPDELAKRARQLIKDHNDALAPILDVDEDGDVADDDLPQYDEINDSYAYDALELLREFVSDERKQAETIARNTLEWEVRDD